MTKCNCEYDIFGTHDSTCPKYVYEYRLPCDGSNSDALYNEACIARDKLQANNKRLQRKICEAIVMLPTHPGRAKERLLRGEKEVKHNANLYRCINEAMSNRDIEKMLDSIVAEPFSEEKLSRMLRKIDRLIAREEVKP